MDLEKILANVEGKDELIKQINAEIGKEFVLREDFNKKNEDYKALNKQLKDQDEALKEAGTYKTQLEELTNKVKSHELNSLKTRIALENGIPYNMVSRVQGEDEESITKDAVSLSEFFKSQQPAPPLKSTERTETNRTSDQALLDMLKNNKE